MDRLKLIVVIVLGVIFVTACDNYDKFTDSPSAELSFSLDTISFDTIFANTPSTTKTLIVKNNGSEGVHIADIRLLKGKDSPYRINIDGEALAEKISDVEVRAGDSIFVFAEVTMPTLPEGESTLVDNLLFTLSGGRQQKVVLSTASLSMTPYYNGLYVERDTTFSATERRVIYGKLGVAKGATLTIEAGTTLYFHPDATLDIFGRLVCNGTYEQPVVLRGDRLDRLFKNLPYDNTVGRWGGVKMHPESGPNALTCTDIHSSDYGIIADTATVVLNSCIIHNIGGVGLSLNDANVFVVNTQVSNTWGNCVNAIGGANEFVFCTFAQFYPWESSCANALYIADKKTVYDIDEKTGKSKAIEVDMPIQMMNFSSCLVTGYADDELMGSIENEASAPYWFGHCVLRTPEVVDEKHYGDIVWELPKNDAKEDLPKQGIKQFNSINTDDFLYDFRPHKRSIGTSVYDPIDVQNFPFDRLGVVRADTIYAGCYQAVGE
ncbi:MAG: hypothetical protein HUK00_01275 [Bacteroidaceae bacterium]|nr:hypothetical protein [Bacteroidaceae bacterium]